MNKFALLWRLVCTQICMASARHWDLVFVHSVSPTADRNSQSRDTESLGMFEKFVFFRILSGP